MSRIFSPIPQLFRHEHTKSAILDTCVFCVKFYISSVSCRPDRGNTVNGSAESLLYTQVSGS
jgi:hypothetical protein